MGTQYAGRMKKGVFTEAQFDLLYKTKPFVIFNAGVSPATGRPRNDFLHVGRSLFRAGGGDLGDAVRRKNEEGRLH